MRHKIEKYAKYFSEGKFWSRLGDFAKRSGIKLVYTALLLFHAYQRKETPAWAKRIVLGALGYLLLPIDLLPDLTPFLGLTDDIGILSFGLVTISAFVNEEVRDKARGQLSKWFDEIDPKELDEVDKQL
jgi:uncharacterized membrane protein YkvA (DUF1232 family)